MRSRATFILLILSALSFGADGQTRIEDVKQSVVQLQRTTCFGACPSYIISIFENGDLIWEGLDHVRRLGVYRGRASPDIFPRALALLESAKYKNFKSAYVYGKAQACKENWTDNPSIRIYVQTKTDEKQIWHNTGCRGFDRENDLLNLERALDEVLDTKKWVGERR